MFFFENEKCEITFLVDKDRKDNFDLALTRLGKTKEEAFDAFLAMLIAKALEQQKDPGSDELYREDSKRLSADVIASRIKRWAVRIYSYPHLMLRSFFKANPSSMDSQAVILPKMHGFFNSFAGLGEDDNAKFTSIFRQMCSASATAYGNVFVYDRRNGLVRINDEYKDLVFALRDKFLHSEGNI